MWFCKATQALTSLPYREPEWVQYSFGCQRKCGRQDVLKIIKWVPPISYTSLNSTHIISQRLSIIFLPPSVHHSSTAHLTYTDIAPAIICFHILLINHIWKVLWSLICLCISSQRRSRQGWSGTSTSTAGRRSASRPRGKAWSTSSPQCRDSSSSLGTIPSSYTAGIS